MLHHVWEVLSGTVSFFSDFLTCILGVATIYAFFRYKGRIAAAIRLLRLSHLNDRSSEVKETLDLILACGIAKGRATELRGLFARLNGQLLPLCDVFQELRDLQVQVEDVAHKNGRLNDAVRQQVVHQIRSQLESIKYTSLSDAAGQK